jgi:hypothetical protein
MPFADAYLDDLGRFSRRPWDETSAELDDTFEKTGDGVLLERSDRDLWEILPDAFTPVPVACAVVGERLTWMEFAFETPMRRLLDVKGRTRGLNTDRVVPRNCHIWLAPVPVQDDLKGCAVIARDRRMSPLPETDVRIPALDLNQALMHGERFQRLLDIGL